MISPADSSIIKPFSIHPYQPQRMRKFIKSIVRFILLLGLLAFVALYWRSLRGVDAFLKLYPTTSRIEYDWLLPWFDGRVRLFGVRVYNGNNRVAVRAAELIADLDSVSTLFTLKESLTLREFPAHTNFFLKNGVTTSDFRFAEMFPFFPQLDLAHSLLPESCQDLSFDPKPFRFEGNLQVLYDLISGRIEWQSEIKSTEFNQLRMHLKQVNFAVLSDDPGYIDEWHLQLSDPLWLHQLNRQCQQHISLQKDSSGTAIPAQFYQQQLAQLGAAHNWNLTTEFSQSLAHWLALPRDIKIDFNPPQSISFNQLAEADVDIFVPLTGLTITLDGQTFREFFLAKAPVNNMQESALTHQTKSQTSHRPTNSPPYISAQYNEVKRWLDAKVAVKLHNGRTLTGYIKQANTTQFVLEVREAQGASLLPFGYNQVKSIHLIRSPY